MKDGTITAGNSSQISDGASALIVMSADRAHDLGLTPIGELMSYSEVAGPDTSLLSQPARAISLAAKKADIALNGLDLFEINEAFAAVTLTSSDEFAVDEEKINVNGEPSRSVIPWACPELASPSLPCWNCSDAAAVLRP